MRAPKNPLFDVSARSPSIPASGASSGAEAPAPSRRKGAIVVVALAFLATCVPPMAEYAPFLVNRTTAAADIRITWVLAKVDCASSPDVLARTLAPSDLDDPRTISLTEPGRSPPSINLRCPASRRWGCAGWPLRGGYPLPCIAAVLESDGTTPVIMLASPDWIVSGNEGLTSCGVSTPQPNRCQATLDPAVDPGIDAVSLVVRNGQTQFAVSSQAADAKIRIAPIDSSRRWRRAHRRPADAALCARRLPGRFRRYGLPHRQRLRRRPGAGPARRGASRERVRDLPEPDRRRQRASGRPELRGPVSGRPTDMRHADSPGCVNGQCTAICVGQTLPYCPPNCTHYPGVASDEGDACNTNIVCFAADGRRCHCAVDTLTIACAADLPLSPSCPYSCRPSASLYSDDAGSPNYVDRTDAATAPTVSPSDAGDGGASPDGGGSTRKVDKSPANRNLLFEFRAAYASPGQASPLIRSSASEIDFSRSRGGRG